MRRASDLLLGRATCEEISPSETNQPYGLADDELLEMIRRRCNDRKFRADVEDIIATAKNGKHGPKPEQWQDAMLVTTVELVRRHLGSSKKAAYIETAKILSMSWTTVRDRYCKAVKKPEFQHII